MAYLGYRGYTIKKEFLEESEITLIKKELSMKPFVPKTSPAVSSVFPVYRESNNKLYLPRFYGYNNYGEPDKVIISGGEDINVNFNGKLRDYQKDLVKQWLEKTKKTGCGLIEADCGAGKCHGINTPIIMFDGCIKMVQNIKIGDQLMGDESTPRNVLSLARGHEMLYDIIPDRGPKYTVNESHILSLKRTDTLNIVDIPLLEYLNLSAFKQGQLKGYRVGVEFQSKPVGGTDPYTYGFNSSTVDDIINIPHNYKSNTRTFRLELLAGIIDAIGLKVNNSYDITSNETVLDDIIFLARSLGYAAYKIQYTVENNVYYKTNIHGNCLYDIPLKLQDRLKNEMYSTKTYLMVDFEIRKRTEDKYYGFQLDGNHRYLMGDFTVTHNTVIATDLISKLKKKTLIIVHKDFLLKQWKERLQEFLPDARIGLIQGPIIDVDDKDIVIGMLQSLSMKEYDADIFKDFGFTIVDEVHHISAEVFSRVLFKVVSKHMLGLSATMDRKDGLTKVFKMFLGDIVAKWKRKGQDNVTVKAIEFTCDDESFNGVSYNYRGQLDYVKMISKISEYQIRNDFILKVLEDFWRDSNNDQIMIIGHRKKQLSYIHDIIKQRGFATVGYYIGGMKEADLKISEGKNIIVATYSMAEEALDIKTLTTIAMITPKKDVRQAVGRILRSDGDKTVLDFVDVHSNFKKYWYDRRKWYAKQKFNIKFCLKPDYFKDNWTTIEQVSRGKAKKIKQPQNLLMGKCLTIGPPDLE